MLRSVPVESKGYIENLEIQDEDLGSLLRVMPFMFRPTETREKVTPRYGKMTVLGMSHDWAVYEATDNVAWEFELYANAHMFIKDNRLSAEEAQAIGASGDVSLDLATRIIELHRRFLESLAYPGVQPDGNVGNNPPLCILCIPGVVSTRVRMMGLEFEFQDLANSGVPLRWTARVAFEEAPVSRIYMRDQALNGMFRM